ncbi:MAG: GHKL domain-containing protein, partial [Chloroflexi bacterium]|nr:GHKL domain-containing protein [Chloroflexota bacterium]
FSSLARTFNAMFERLQTAFGQMEETLIRQKHFTADASHELRTPLTTVQANAEWALRRDRTAAEHREAWLEVKGASWRMARLVEDLLCLARSDALPPDSAPAPITEVFQRAIASQTGDAAARARITIEPFDPSLAARGDSDGLVRLVSNLLENAIHYTPPDGTIRLSARKEHGVIRLVVQDTGEGIPPDHLPHVCERFYRVDAARSRPGGAGLGLAICQSIARQHGGDLHLESTPGKGTTATVVLPPADPVTNPGADPLLPNGRDVAEDDPQTSGGG